MKRNLSYFACFILSFSALSCYKHSGFPDEKGTPPATPIQGEWIGTYLANSAPDQPQLLYSLNIQSGGFLSVQSQAPTYLTFALGSWTLSGDTLQCNYTYTYPIVSQSSSAFYSNGTLTSGVWRDIYNSGTFIVTQKN
jgi:hypothetical protein